ncbi:MAG: superoxide dismutase [Patescibacteria group bacterium]
MKFELPKLNFAFDALEPCMDARTVEIHYTKHHQIYLDKFNTVLEKTGLEYDSAEEILRDLNKLNVGDDDRKVIKNMGGGYVNHNIFWDSLGPEKVNDAKLAEDIQRDFGSIEKFKEGFTKLAIGHFASGYAWAVRDESGKLSIYSLPNQDSPYTLGHEPVFCLDVWEHAYYLKYQNRRPEFVDSWWNILKFI